MAVTFDPSLATARRRGDAHRGAVERVLTCGPAVHVGAIDLPHVALAVVKRLHSSLASAVDNTAKASEHEDALSTLRQRVTELQEQLQLSSEGRRQDADQAAEARRAGHERGLDHHRAHTACLTVCLLAGKSPRFCIFASCICRKIYRAVTAV